VSEFTYQERIESLLENILEELKKLNEKKTKTKRETVLSTGLPMIAQIWNREADPKLPRVVEMDVNGTRYKACTARWTARPNEAYWVNVIQRMNRSSFCLGQGKDRWLANIDFLCRPDTSGKILEGQYDDKSQEKPKEFFGYHRNENGELIPIYK
jgi:hypothetical protein